MLHLFFKRSLSGSKRSESNEHKLIKEKMASFLNEISGSQIMEYQDSGHESDVFSVTYKGISIITEIIWSLQKRHIYSDFLILSNSFANIKVLIMNHNFYDDKDKYQDIRRDYEKLRISEIRKGYIISEAFDSDLVINNKMEEIKDFLDYSITLLSFDNELNEKHLTDFKNNIVRPILSYLGNSSIDIGVIPQIGNEDLFYDYLRHFNLELQWNAITDSQEGISSLRNDIESEFRTFCNQNGIPVVDQIRTASHYDDGVFVGDISPDPIDKIPIKDFVKRLINLPHNHSFERILNNRLTIETYPNENIIKFRMEESSAGNISIIYQGRTETQDIFNHLREYVINHRNSINISKLKEIEEKLINDINKFKQSIEKTLYLHILPTNVQCPFLKLG